MTFSRTLSRRTPWTRFVGSLLAATVVSGVLVVGGRGVASVRPAELFFSEYVEGSSNNKAIEVFNGTGAGVDLGAREYNVQIFSNGQVTASATIGLGEGTVADGDVWVIAHTSASVAVLDTADQTSLLTFNGDDALVLRRGTTIIDSIGQVGFDPGIEWGAGDTSTSNHTLRRKPDVRAGDENPSDAFDPAAEWNGFAQDDIANLGTHAIPNALIVGEGPATTGAANWHLNGLTGSGVKVAVIDRGFAGLAHAQDAGDVPMDATSVDQCSGNFATATDHGTAAAEVVHEMAPDADLYLICVGTTDELGFAKDYAVANGIDVVSDSTSWFNSARGDGSGGPGTPDAVVAEARTAGILWVSAAGDYQQKHWTGTFVDGGETPLHQFAAGDETNSFTVPAGESFCAYLKWDEWSAPPVQNYDLVLGSGGAPIAVSANVQDGTAGQRPTESVCGIAPESETTFELSIRESGTTQTPRMDLFVDGPIANLEHRVPAGSVAEPGSSPHAFTVGAIHPDTNAVEPFSSMGATIDGRIKPDIAAPNRVSGSTYGVDGFVGTGAAAAHVAGAAALVLQAFPGFTPAGVQSFLEARALDLGEAGKDNSSGAGKLRLRAFDDVPPSDFAFPYVEAMLGRGITSGCTGSSAGVILYCPTANVTRGQMSKFLMVAAGKTELNSATPTFADVPSSHPFYGWIERMNQLGVTSGCSTDPQTGDRFYCPSDPVNRGQMAKFLMIAAGETELAPSEPTFVDVPPSHTFFGWIERVAAKGITSGCSVDPGTGDVSYCPSASVNRRQMAKFLVLAFPMLSTYMTGEQEPAADLNGWGFARFESHGAQFCYELFVANIPLPATGAHIHTGGPGVNGPITVPLNSPGANGTSTGCFPRSATTDQILANPGAYYVNVHSTEWPGGAVRGQLTII